LLPVFKTYIHTFFIAYKLKQNWLVKASMNPQEMSNDATHSPILSEQCSN